MTGLEQIASSAICHAADMVKIAWQQVAYDMQQPHIMLRPKIYPDGNMWCCLYGDNLQEGVAGFGETPAKASYDFDKNWLGQKLEPKET